MVCRSSSKSSGLYPKYSVKLACGSASIVRTFCSSSTNACARLKVEVVLPTPPFWFAIAIIIAIVAYCLELPIMHFFRALYLGGYLRACLYRRKTTVREHTSMSDVARPGLAWGEGAELLKDGREELTSCQAMSKP